MSMAIHLAKRMTRTGSLPSVTFTNLAQLKEYEADAAYPAGEHWIFDRGSSAGLAGMKSGGLLTDAGAAKTWNAYSVTLAGSLGSRLNSTYSDRLTYSICAVVKVPATGSGGGIGTPIASTQQGTAKCGVMFALQGGTSIDLASRAIISGASSQQSWNTANFTVGEWRWFGFVIDHTGANRLRRFSLGTVHQDFTDSAAFTPSPANKIGIGSTSNDVATPAAIEVAEFIVFPDIALTTAQLEAVYGRSQARMSRRSLGAITVV